MSGGAWVLVSCLMGVACLVVCRWWVRLTDVREPRYLYLLQREASK